MKRLFGLAAAAACAFTASPAHALPTYAVLVARDHCEYLRNGWSWDDASTQALRDNIIWLDEMKADGSRASRTIALAIKNECNDINRAAFDRR